MNSSLSIELEYWKKGKTKHWNEINKKLKVHGSTLVLTLEPSERTLLWPFVVQFSHVRIHGPSRSFRSIVSSSGHRIGRTIDPQEIALRWSIPRTAQTRLWMKANSRLHWLIRGSSAALFCRWDPCAIDPNQWVEKRLAAYLAVAAAGGWWELKKSSIPIGRGLEVGQWRFQSPVAGGGNLLKRLKVEHLKQQQ